MALADLREALTEALAAVSWCEFTCIKQFVTQASAGGGSPGVQPVLHVVLASAWLVSHGQRHPLGVLVPITHGAARG
jgi:hypothetical protein